MTTELPSRDAARDRIKQVRSERAKSVAPVLPWAVFTGKVFRWRQGEHLAMIGPTGSGKTTLSLHLLGLRKYVVALGTKPADQTLDMLVNDAGFKRFESWENVESDRYPKRIIWPDARALHSAQAQRREFRNALAEIYRQGSWCVYIDELWFIIHHLKLELEIRTYLQQARSIGISLAVATQRPAFVPLEIYDQSTHLFFWRDNDERNLSRISGISWRSSADIKHLISELERHQVLYINTITGDMFRTTCPETVKLPRGGKS